MNNLISEGLVIPKEYPYFPQLLFVLTALEKDEADDKLTHMLVEKEDRIWNYVATDGRRIHKFELDPGLFEDDLELLEAGHYSLTHKSSKVIVLCKSQTPISSIKWREIFPEKEPNEILTLSSAAEIGKAFLRIGNLYNITYLQEALAYGSALKPSLPCHAEYFTEKENSPLLIHHEHGQAYIMPLTLTDEIDEE